MNNLPAYLARIGLTTTPKANLASLALIMAAHSRSIAFENCDVVLKNIISVARPDVEQKLVASKRGGYCFEQNTLLQMALEEIGYQVAPLMCRVRWGKPDDSEEENTTFTHMALRVTLDGGGGEYLADVGFAGTNSMAPVKLGSTEPQSLPEGEFRIAAGRPGYFALQLLVKGEWRPLYTWRNERAAVIDIEAANWFSCTYPHARFTTSCFVSKVVGDERHHILNNNYVIRKGHGVSSSVETVEIKDNAQLLGLLDSVFDLAIDKNTVGLDRYL
jgi:N-hydroxyarylamine O-acetyltransferase